MKVYENSFDSNEWFVIVSLVLFIFLIWITPKIFSFIEGTAHFVYGFFIGMFYDHTISVPPWDFYDVNDNSGYQFIDFLSYLMYGPYSYFFIYLYAKLNIKGYMTVVYLLIWLGISLLIEWIAIKVGIFHYEKGFKMFWSAPIYMSAQILQIIYYHLIKMNESKSN
ncbi:hypothetical protein [Bacillus sp. Marseille-Q3570]|uniref:hypothetical protein n=1 Tax=Bacillus sp. Marseille-Q3570 TaxID=2963522 RepID=UPI0021B7CA12|nr:hypothetical protein [Bacillus sp. Marseille-Q3570]